MTMAGRLWVRMAGMTTGVTGTLASTCVAAALSRSAEVMTGDKTWKKGQVIGQS